MKFRVVTNGVEKTATLLSRTANSVEFEINGEVHSVTALPLNLHHNSQRENSTTSSQISSRAQNPTLQGSPFELRAPIAGTVSSLLCSVGEGVEQGQTVIVLEAMKMENNITAPISAIVDSLAVSVGDQVKGGQLLLTFLNEENSQ